MKLDEAVKTVNAAIEAERKRLEKIAQTDEQSPVTLEGETYKDYYCQLMVDPKEVAPIMLNHDYPLYEVLGEDAPTAMWDDLAQKFGLSRVLAVDL